MNISPNAPTSTYAAIELSEHNALLDVKKISNSDDKLETESSSVKLKTTKKIKPKNIRRDSKGLITMGFEDILNLTSYRVNSITASEKQQLAEILRDLIVEHNDHSETRSTLVNSATYFLDNAFISEYSQFDFSDDSDSGGLLLSNFELKMQNEIFALLLPIVNGEHNYSLNVDFPTDEPIDQTYSHIKETAELQSEKFEKLGGGNRDVYINKETGYGYKIMKKSHCFEAELINARADLRLNSIYKNKGFYGGMYSEFANFDSVTVTDSETGQEIQVASFRKIPHAKPLNKHEKIPHSVVMNLQALGYFPHDVIPCNFIKIKNEANGETHYLPIDAKLIARARSSSFRSSKYSRSTIANPFTAARCIRFHEPK